MSLLAKEMHPLLTDEVIEKLRHRNVKTTHAFLQHDTKVLAEVTGLVYKNILLIKKQLLNKNSAVVWRGDDYYKSVLKRTAIVPTGCERLDKFLGGGLCTGNVYELSGPPASGKTQLCHHFTANYASKYRRKILYLDCKGDFSVDRLKRLVETTAALENVLVKRVHSMCELINALYEVQTNYAKAYRVKAVIVDSLPALVDLENDVERRNALLSCAVGVVRFIVHEYYVAFVVTNVVTTWREGRGFGDGSNLVEKVGCGRYWSSVPNVKLKIGKLSTGNYRLEVVKSVTLKEGESVEFSMTDKGIS